MERENIVRKCIGKVESKSGERNSRMEKFEESVDEIIVKEVEKKE